MTKPLCKRCNRPFDPNGIKVKLCKGSSPARFCADCMVRNLMDALGVPTPPELLDRYSKHPTLTEREFRTELDKIPDSEDEPNNPQPDERKI